MNKRLVSVSAAFAIALPLALSGCGNKGPLVLADDAPVEPTIEAPTPEAAAETTPPPVALPPADGTPAH